MSVPAHLLGVNNKNQLGREAPESSPAGVGSSTVGRLRDEVLRPAVVVHQVLDQLGDHGQVDDRPLQQAALEVSPGAHTSPVLVSEDLVQGSSPGQLLEDVPGPGRGVGKCGSTWNNSPHQPTHSKASGSPWLDTTRISHPPARPVKYLTACELGDWSIASWPRDFPEKVQIRPFKCRSWRHPGECARWKGAQDFVRIKEALESREGWAFMVMTIGTEERRTCDKGDVYRRLWRKTQSLVRWMRRRWGKLEYIALVEQHRDGWPHVNITFHCPGFLQEVDEMGWKEVHKTVKAAVVRSGWGYILHTSELRDKEAMAGYFVKLGHQLATTLSGEVAKLSQVPIQAPRNFRRLRSSKGLLPPVHKNQDFTGCLIQSPVERVSEEYVQEVAYQAFEKEQKKLQEVESGMSLADLSKVRPRDGPAGRVEISA